MHVEVVGHGKLASELLTGLAEHRQFTVAAWPKTPSAEHTCVVVHAGSGREMSSVIDYCERSACPLIELAKGSQLETARVGFPVVLCPNTNLLMLKVISMLANSAHLFRGEAISVLESHQSSKTTEPGTALAIAQSLGVPAEQVVSVRDPMVQRRELAIPEEHLGRHAVHRFRFRTGRAPPPSKLESWAQRPMFKAFARSLEPSAGTSSTIASTRSASYSREVGSR